MVGTVESDSNGAGFIVLPDADRVAAAANELRASPGARVLTHASGRPWIVGHWPQGEVRVVAAGRTRLAVAGFCPVTTAELTEAATRLTDVASIDCLASLSRGSAHLMASVAGQVRLQGTASGVRAFFHARVAGATVAADRPEALAAVTGADIDEDLVALRLLSFGVPHPLRERPLWQGVHQVPPDHALLLGSDGKPSTVRWWTPPTAALSRTQGVSAVRQALSDAVHSRVGAANDVVSTDLSGGMDSGTLAHLAAGQARHLITVRTPQLDTAGDDALWAARITARLPHTQHLTLDYEQAPTMFAGMDSGKDMVVPAEPPYWTRAGARFADTSARVAALGSRLHLCGHGGDELFHLPAATLHSMVRARPWTGIRHLSSRRALAHWPWGATVSGLTDSRTFHGWLEHCSAELRKPPPSIFTPDLGWTMPMRMPPWATPQAEHAVRNLLLQTAQSQPQPLQEGRGAHRVLDSLRNAGAMVRYASWVMAAHGAQLAAPYLDDQVITAALAVRPHERATPRQYKPLLAEAMRGLVPDDILGRSTKGDYTTDAFDGLRRHKATLLHLFDGSELSRMGLIEDTAVQNMLRTVHTTGQSLLALEPTLACELWLRSLSRPRKHPATTAGER
ncbi:asparagine synthase [Streptomyces tauricus]|nr:asparagine synthase [Streptomyces tauricus]